MSGLSQVLYIRDGIRKRAQVRFLFLHSPFAKAKRQMMDHMTLLWGNKMNDLYSNFFVLKPDWLFLFQSMKRKQSRGLGMSKRTLSRAF